MNLKIAVVGMRHGHITALISHAKARPDTEIVALCEEDDETRKQLVADGQTPTPLASLDALLADVDCDVIAIGDYYAKRGAIAIQALQHGKHVIADKPLCTRIDELEEISGLASGKGLKVGCMLDMRNSPRLLAMHAVLAEGLIGEVQAVSFGGQHPLMRETRAAWYFEEGKHGGTINDIGIHAIDALPWLTGLDFSCINAARGWNALATGAPFMKDCAQMMLTLENGAGVLGDVSYLMPNSQGYSHPYYWRFTLWGTKGILETSATSDCLTLSLDGEKAPRSLPLGEGRGGGYLQDFVDDINGVAGDDAMATAGVIKSSLTTLRIQQAADEGLTNVKL
ncbi:MAG: Gfo/Idh/MocA family oxidoreductase [Lentisphaerae bacterium]|jgi:predicted dehydrogenase|nr:Gfo/Idh/MocA family oxidoreductase [Lentisphaerota bacterium]MBT4814135.1 Gfo/Idh/MocA family oxidoreductase [Lentisphaerota bacterium]MBT5609045.1 Gfo/Idh/MocA family oxidoreductase [Lentisphaerota bacterium]MBT7055477.1 Gfo/Idh/MocA family oxidoreductase [Lentisphaerota bacterium]MBT7846056.1 Gfo/Idh/MocA family oxidoreductase [Lentisphaerota bacterium]